MRRRRRSPRSARACAASATSSSLTLARRRRRRRVARARAREPARRCVAVEPRHETLEDLFLRQIAGADAAASARRKGGVMLGRIWAIALNTFREAARIRVLYGILVLVVGANLLAIVLGQMSIHEEARVARDIGLAGISLFGSLTAIFLGVFLLYTEVQRRTIHAIVSKPIERWEFVVGKYLGMALVLTMLVGLFAVAMAGMLAVAGRRRVERGRQGDRARVVRGAHGRRDRDLLLVVLDAVPVGHLRARDVGARPGHARHRGRDRDRRAVDPSDRAGRARDRPRHPPVLAVGPDRRRRRPSACTATSCRGATSGSRRCTALGWIVGLLALACLLFQRRDFA